MKKMIMLAVGLLIAVMSYGQNNAVSYASAWDTLTGADTASYQYPQLINTPYGYAVQHHTVKLTGTGASTNGYTQVSLDGTNWVNLDSIQTVANGSGYRTITKTTGLTYPYLRVYSLQTGTVETTKGKVWFQIYPMVNDYYFPAPPTYQLITNDTLTNTDTKAGAYPSPLNGVYDFSVQIVMDELTGAATNTVTVQTSNDNTNWTTLTTFTLTSDTTVVYQSVAGVNAKYIRVYESQTGTATSKNNAYIQLYLRKF